VKRRLPTAEELRAHLPEQEAADVDRVVSDLVERMSQPTQEELEAALAGATEALEKAVAARKNKAAVLAGIWRLSALIVGGMALGAEKVGEEQIGDWIGKGLERMRARLDEEDEDE